ncbi:R1 [Scenedesmus sp. PABB004]|nr:R1 [Scenedesmus sp. PABB004]
MRSGRLAPAPGAARRQMLAPAGRASSTLTRNGALARAAPRRPARGLAPAVPRPRPCPPLPGVCRAASVLQGGATGARESPRSSGDSTASPAAVGEWLLRRWIGLGNGDELPFHHEAGPLRHTSCELTVCATTLEAKGRKHVLLAFVVTGAAGRSGGKALGINDLRAPLLHWGQVSRQGSGWGSPSPGWSTWPDVSHDARGAWQTPFAEQQLPGVGPALTLLVQVPYEAALKTGGLAFLVKAGSKAWLGNAATNKDFFFATGALPAVPAASLEAADAGALAGDAALVAPESVLDMETLAKVPVVKRPPSTNGHHKHNNNNNGHHHHHDNNNGHHHNHHGEPELPNAGRREKEPQWDDSMVCTLSGAELHRTAQQQLTAWAAQQHDLEVPELGLSITQHEFPVKGHASTPFVVACTALWRTAAAAGGAREAVLLVAAMGDVGLTGKRHPGLVLQWSGVGPDAAALVGRDPEAAARMAATALPDGWGTLPDLSWDAGSGFWDTPMTRHLFELPAAGAPTRPAAPAAPTGSGPPSDKYLVLLRLPLTAEFATGGLLFNMRTSRRQWIRNADNSGPFFLDTSVHAQRLGVPPPGAAPDAAHAANGAAHAAHGAAATNGAGLTAAERDDQVVWATTRAALVAAGLSDEEIAHFAKSMPSHRADLFRPPTPGGRRSPSPLNGAGANGNGRAAHANGNGNGRAASPTFDVLSSADAEMAAHISAHSSVDGRGGVGGEVARFMRGFDPASATDLSAAPWGLPGDGAMASEGMEVPELTPHPWLIGKIAELEHNARRSLMHRRAPPPRRRRRCRYGIAAELVGELLHDLRAAAHSAPEALAWPPPPGAPTAGDDHSVAGRGRRALSGLVAVAVWLRLSALRLLTWNHNYNVKPREISAALDRLGDQLVQGGMMEEWHQKLHNNTSPDDLVICDALLAYLAAGQAPSAYWDTLKAEGITAERLASYDRPIKSGPPTFDARTVPQLTSDLIAYRRTLAAVHSGADLSAAIDGVLGYDAGNCKGKHVKVDPLTAVATPQLRQLLGAILALVQGGSAASSPSGTRPGTPAAANGTGSKVGAMMDMERALQLQALVVAARSALAPALRGGSAACQGRLRDVIFLDLALELTGRVALEQGLTAVRAAAPSTLLGGLLALLQQPLASACFSALPGQGGNAALVAICSQLAKLSCDCPGLDAGAKARCALSLIERLRSLLAGGSGSAIALLQPTAWHLAGALQVRARAGSPRALLRPRCWARAEPAPPPPRQIENHGDPLGPVGLLAEEVVRGSAAAALSLVLTAVEPSLRRLAGVSAWTVVSRLPPRVCGHLSPLQPCLSQLAPGTIEPGRPTILALQRLAGEEEVPPGVVGVIVLGDCPDVLSHAAVRARNCRVPVVACPSSEQGSVDHVASLAGRQVVLNISGDEVQLLEAGAADAAGSGADAARGGNGGGPAPVDAAAVAAALAARALTAPVWDGSWVLQPDRFAPGVVGGKAMSAAMLGAPGGTRASRPGSPTGSPSRPGSPSGGRPASPGAGGARRGPLLPPWLRVPPAIALPHGTFEAVLAAPVNADVAAQLKAPLASVAAAAAAQPGSAPGAELEHIRSLVAKLQPPRSLEEDLQLQLSQLAVAAASPDPSYGWGDVWAAIKSVWASQWNARAVSALGKAALPLAELRMGVLVQPLLPARYSWVAHTVNPASGDEQEIVVQLVVGLGEVLVGNHPGRALGGVIKRSSLDAALAGMAAARAPAPAPAPPAAPQGERQRWTIPFFGNGAGRTPSSPPAPPATATVAAPSFTGAAPLPEPSVLADAVDVVSYMSKDAAIIPRSLALPCAVGEVRGDGDGSDTVSRGPAGVVFMARSDSNAEDLPGFAGAGLFDSVPSLPNRHVTLDYAKEPLVWDEAAAAGLLWQCALAAVAAEAAVTDPDDGPGTPGYEGLDVEGCVTPDGTIWLLQARPQPARACRPARAAKRARAMAASDAWPLLLAHPAVGEDVGVVTRLLATSRELSDTVGACCEGRLVLDADEYLWRDDYEESMRWCLLQWLSKHAHLLAELRLSDAKWTGDSDKETRQALQAAAAVRPLALRAFSGTQAALGSLPASQLTRLEISSGSCSHPSAAIFSLYVMLPKLTALRSARVPCPPGPVLAGCLPLGLRAVEVDQGYGWGERGRSLQLGHLTNLTSLRLVGHWRMEPGMFELRADDVLPPNVEVLALHNVTLAPLAPLTRLRRLSLLVQDASALVHEPDFMFDLTKMTRMLAPELFRGLAAFDRWEALELELEWFRFEPGTKLERLFNSWAGEEAQLWAAADALYRELASLPTASLLGAVPTLAGLPLLERLTGLTRLSLNYEHWHCVWDVEEPAAGGAGGGEGGAEPACARDRVQALAGTLGQLTTLREVRLDNLDDLHVVQGRMADGRSLAPALAALAALPHLAGLELWQCGPCNGGLSVAEARALESPSLTRLVVGTIYHDCYDKAYALTGAAATELLRGLPGLRELDLHMQPPPGPDVLTRAALVPALRELRALTMLWVCDRLLDEGSRAQLRASLPALRVLETRRDVDFEDTVRVM